MRRIFRENGLSIVLFLMFVFSLVGQSLTGHKEYNDDQLEHRRPTISFAEYLKTGHFIEATFENWESEFLQMATFVVLTIFLYQKGSSESKEPGRIEEFDVVPADSRMPKKAPWPMRRRRGLVRILYENSLSIALLALFLMSFVLHAVGGAEEYNQDQLAHGSQQFVSTIGYMETSRFWFESFQNWQSEFLSVLVMIVFTIFLRQKGSPESKPVYAEESDTED